MNLRTPVPRTISQIVADLESQAARSQESHYVQPPPKPHPSMGTVLRITWMDLRRLVRSAALRDPDALRLGDVVMAEVEKAEEEARARAVAAEMERADQLKAAQAGTN